MTTFGALAANRLEDMVFLVIVVAMLGPAPSLAQTSRPAPRQRALDYLRSHTDPGDVAWLRQATRTQLDGCRLPAHDGTTLFTPDGEGHYAALWTRDFQYMVQYAGDLLDPGEIKSAIVYLLKGQRSDGCMPDRVQADGVAVYSPGSIAHPLANCALDNGPFMAKLVAQYVRLTGDMDFFRQHEPALRKGLDFVPRAGNGLVYNDPARPQCPYGFTDTVAKTGHLLFTSLLYYEACLDMHELSQKASSSQANVYRQRADVIRPNVSLLWDDQAGMFLAADADCRQIDIWGSALAVNLGVASPEQSRRIIDYLVQHADRVFKRGQVRHLPAPQAWSRTFIPVKVGQYQNGAYWAVPHAWLLPALAEKRPELALRLLGETIKDFRTNGINECVNDGYRNVPNYVTSATNLYGVVAR